MREREGERSLSTKAKTRETRIRKSDEPCGEDTIVLVTRRWHMTFMRQVVVDGGDTHGSMWQRTSGCDQEGCKSHDEMHQIRWSSKKK